MSRLNPQQGLMPSIIDRLVDPETSGTAWRRGYELQQVVDAVRRDLEDLLNTHQVYQEKLTEWPELSASLLTYGLPDLASMDAITPEQRQGIGKTIEAIIARFEPRLRNVRANLVESGLGVDRTVRFHIDAQLNVDPAPEVAFETILELSTGHATIKKSDTTE